jgi:hypothetical protein
LRPALAAPRPGRPTSPAGGPLPAVSRGLLVALAALVTVGLGSGPAAGAVGRGPDLVTLHGIVQQDVVDDDAAHDVATSAEALHLDTTVLVGDTVLDVPESLVPAAGTPGAVHSGDAVDVTLRTDGRVGADEALRAVQDATRGAAPSSAQVVAHVPAPTTAERTAAAIRSVLGAHTLTVLPVQWSTSTPPVSRATLGTMATASAEYWSEQSGGKVTFRPTVADWRTIADPGTCDTTAIMDRALAAHGASRASGNDHVALYFPERADCAWAGRGSISGGNIWINGEPLVDVLAHELGHNLGIGHANTATCTSGSVRVPLSGQCAITPYADTADVMGYATQKVTGSLNSAFADHLGLTTVRQITSLPATVDVARLADVGSARAVKLATSFGTVYVDFRPAQGRDVREPAWAGVQVHRVVDPTYPQTELLDMRPTSARAFSSPSLPVGGSWDVPGTGQRLTVTATGTTSATLTLTSTAPAPTPTPTTPAPTTSPTTPATPALGSNLTFVPVTPTRILDTRDTGTPLGAGATRDLVVAGSPGVPANALGVALNVTAVGATATTHLRMWPTGQAVPESSVLNTDPTRVTATGLMLGLGKGGVSVHNNAGSVHVIADVTGYFVASGGQGYAALSAPVRLLDTRTSGGAAARALTSGESRTIPVAGLHGVPSTATAVVVNVTSVGAAADGFLVAHPGGTARPVTSTVNHLPGGDATNRATIRLGAGGLTVGLQGADAHVVVDLVGWFGPTGTGRFTPVAPVRAFDTRSTGRPVQAGETRQVAVRPSGAPSGARTAVMVVTAAGITANASFVTAWDGSGARPTTSDLNVRRGKDRSNLALVPWAADGTVRVYNDLGDLHLIGDVYGYFS